MPPVSHDAHVGTLLGERYRVESILGRGGTSTVFRAVHVYTGRSVALKLLTPEHAANAELVQRFLREARAASALVHPNSIHILDMGRLESGDVYLAMELVEGETLADFMQREGALSVSRVTELLVPVMQALAAAHALGIVHRDVKPENIMLARRPDGGVRPVLLDFGIARVSEPEPGWGRTTRTGTVLGTPYYMSPEQASAGDPGPASDVWSMGVVLYECVSGRLPYEAPSLRGILLALSKGEHVPVAVRCPHIDPAWAQIIERALAHEAADRYSDMGQMVTAVQSIPNRPGGEVAATALVQPTSARANELSVTMAAPAERRSPRRRLFTLLAASLVGSALLAVAMVAFPLRDATATSAPPPRPPTTVQMPEPAPLREPEPVVAVAESAASSAHPLGEAAEQDAASEPARAAPTTRHRAERRNRAVAAEPTSPEAPSDSPRAAEIPRMETEW